MAGDGKIGNRRLVTPENKEERLAKALQRWEKLTKPLKDAVRASERLTEKDFQVRINAKD